MALAEEKVVEAGLDPLEQEAVSLFVRLARLLGQPKSVGEIYGLLFISEQPLTLEAIMGRLNMSKGSASQGLKFLRGLGAVRVVYQAGDRRDHHQAEASLKVLAAGFIRGEVLPHLESGEASLVRMEELAKSLPADEPGRLRRKFGLERVRRLANWHRRGRQILPLILKFTD
jgi:HTH-type transcriptional regulator, glycine betaine synthesis regulator